MKKPIQISIPTPCHENWDTMALADRGRFCTSCQKTVLDFTNSSDREIASILKNTENACGRFANSQLNRDLVIPKEKSSLWMAASVAVVSFLTIGVHESIAQQKKPTSQVAYSKKKQNKIASSLPEMKITGRIVDTDSTSIPGANIRIIRTNKVIQADTDGNFELTVRKNDKIEISYTGMLTKYITANEDKKLTIILEQDAALASCIDIQVYRTTTRATSGATHIVVSEIHTKKRTFFGRVFHSIGNMFR